MKLWKLLYHEWESLDFWKKTEIFDFNIYRRMINFQFKIDFQTQFAIIPLLNFRKSLISHDFAKLNLAAPLRRCWPFCFHLVLTFSILIMRHKRNLYKLKIFCKCSRTMRLATLFRIEALLIIKATIRSVIFLNDRLKLN